MPRLKYVIIVCILFVSIQAECEKDENGQTPMKEGNSVGWLRRGGVFCLYRQNNRNIHVQFKQQLTIKILSVISQLEINKV